MKPLLSIAIATKNREKYCIEAIKSILAYKSEKIEIAISDNSESTKVYDFVKEINSSNIKYQYDSGPISSIENFNRVMGLTSGEYVILIGDDDSILPKAIEMADWAKKNNIDSICSKESLPYYWPGAVDKYAEGCMIVSSYTGNIKKVNIRKNLEALLKNGLQLYLLYPLPKTYHGIVKKSLMEEVKNRTGHYYGGLSPDLYSSIAVSCVAKNHYLIDEPLSIAGVCAVSTTADNFKGAHSGSLKNIPHLKHRVNYQFTDKIPMYYSVNTIWAESGMKALEELKENKLIKKYNVFRLMAQAWINNKRYIPELMKEKHIEYINQKKINKFTYLAGISKAMIRIYLKKFLQIIKKYINKKHANRYFGIDNLTDVISKYNTLKK